MNTKKYMLSCILVIVLGAGCLLNYEDDPPRMAGRGGYTLSIEPVAFDSYTTAARLIIVSIEPDSNFSGEVTFGIDLPGMITSVPEGITLDREHPVGEFELHLDAGIPLGTKEVAITATHDGMNITTPIVVNVVTAPGEFLSYTRIVEYPYPYDFVMWMADHHPEYGIEADSTWFCYYENPLGPMSFYPRYFNTEWEVIYRSADYSNLIWLAIRKRGDVEPRLFLRGVRTGYDPLYGIFYEWEEIPPELFGVFGEEGAE